MAFNSDIGEFVLLVHKWVEKQVYCNFITIRFWFLLRLLFFCAASIYSFTTFFSLTDWNKQNGFCRFMFNSDNFPLYKRFFSLSLFKMRRKSFFKLPVFVCWCWAKKKPTRKYILIKVLHHGKMAIKTRITWI